MIEFLKEIQLDLMLVLGGICAIIAFFVYVAKTLTNRRKAILMCMEIGAMLLLLFDRYAYIYRGQPDITGYWMVRISNFTVFFMLIFVVHTFVLYLEDLVKNEMGLSAVPVRLKAANILAVASEILLVILQPLKLFYYFDETNTYHRGSGFLCMYLMPIAICIICLSVIIQYYGRINKGIRFSLLLFTGLPGVAALAGYFLPGISVTNISVVATVILLYIFALLDMTETAAKVNKLEIEYLTEERRSMQRLFQQTATAFVTAIDAKDLYTRGHSLRVAEYAKKIASAYGKTEQECQNVYFAALLHDVGKIGIPDSVICNEGELSDEQAELVREKPLIGNQILSGITEYPFLSEGAHFSCEKYDGTGYPDRLAGDDIPETARIIAVADAYDTMTSQKSNRDPLPKAVVREELLKASGTQFDPDFVKIMIELMDSEDDVHTQENNGITMGVLTKELHCTDYRSSVLPGIVIAPEETGITFTVKSEKQDDKDFSAPSIIIFDSFDGREHNNSKAVKAYHYMEYGEVWFDGHYISTNARNMEVSVLEAESAGNAHDRDKTRIEMTTENIAEQYRIEAGRFKDHLKIKMYGAGKAVEIIIALPDASKWAYIGLTGEHCHISDIKIEQTGKIYSEGDIPRIAEEISYIDRMTGDVPNVQIDGTRERSSAGFAIRNGMRLMFHSMNLPGANLVWHCPYLVIYYSSDGQVGGEDYREYALIKWNGEAHQMCDYAENTIVLEKNENFKDWEDWEERLKKGIDCEVNFRRKNNRIILTTESLGISINNTTLIKDGQKDIYVAITGDQCAITDIRVRSA
ncbi:MAG: HD domain-containing protein [Lachnospiraceae bacterium]|nr:HD domain-containing protein [Lachnospiraceae bacterium]